IASGANAGTLATAGYIPYSGKTPAEGLTQELVAYSEEGLADGSFAGKIVVFDVPKVPATLGIFKGIALRVVDPENTLLDSTPYERDYEAIGPLTEIIEALEAAGAAASIGVINGPASAANGTYWPYDRKLRNLPSLFVDRDVGAKLKAAIG